MQDIWIESFYNEIDAEKRQAFLKEHTGDPKDELDEKKAGCGSSDRFIPRKL